MRRKYGIKAGTWLLVENAESGKIVLWVIPKFQDLIGADAGKTDYKKTVAELDRMRSQDRY